MFERYLIDETNFRNVAEKGVITGFQVGIRAATYSNMRVNRIGRFELHVDGVEYPETLMSLTVDGQTFKLTDAKARAKAYWPYGQVAILTVSKPGGLSEGMHDILYTQHDAMPKPPEGESLPAGMPDMSDGPFAPFTTGRKRCKLNGMIKRGVSLYSYQQEYVLKQLTLEEMIAAAAETGATGIEIIGDTNIPRGVSDAFVERWYEWMDKYHVEPTCYDGIESRAETDDESMQYDIKTAAKLGFKVIRVHMPFEYAVKYLPMAEEHGVILAPELHAPFNLDTPDTLAKLEQVAKIDSKYLGFVLDGSMFHRYPDRITMERNLRLGMDPSIIPYILECYKNGTDYREAKAYVRANGGSDLDARWAHEALTICHFTDRETLAPYMPYIAHVHGKILEMTLAGTEYSVDYPYLVDTLKSFNWSGYINTEYEGQRHVQDNEFTEVTGVDQVRRHQKLLSKLLDN